MLDLGIVVMGFRGVGIVSVAGLVVLFGDLIPFPSLLPYT